MFMNSSAKIWDSLREAITQAGFLMVTANIFDKQHGTFKQFVSENTAGADLVIHCLKPSADVESPRDAAEKSALLRDVEHFLADCDIDRYRQVYLHVLRQDELDYRRLYSEWLCNTVLRDLPLLDFSEFRATVDDYLFRRGY
jgi:hypothetical protein